MSPDAGVIGWDLGGAHLKAAWAASGAAIRQVEIRPLALWRGLDELDQAVAWMAERLPLTQCAHRLTMTGELVDLFDDRRQGVRRLSARMARLLPQGRLLVYAGPGGFLAPAEAASRWEDIASANWHATLVLMARLQRSGLLVDIGSTTADLLPLRDARPDNRAYTDRERLAAGELVYTGVVRTPLMALADTAPFAGRWHGLMNEHFATTADVYRILGLLPADADLHATADGGDKSVEASVRRLARMIGADARDGGPADWRRLAAYFMDRQLDLLARAGRLLLSRAADGSWPLIGAGVGAFLAARLAQRLDCPHMGADEVLAPLCGDAAGAADCVPAVAVARLGIQADET